MHCSDVLDPGATTPTAPTPPMQARTILVVGLVGAILVALLHVTGLGFSMRLLPAHALGDERADRIEAMVEGDVLSPVDGELIASQLRREDDARLELASGTLSEVEAVSLRARLPDEDQSTVIGVGGLLRLIPLLLAFIVAGTVGTALARARQPREVLLGLSAAAVIQLILWTAALELDLAALLGGRLIIAGFGPGFVGGPILLLAVTAIAAIAAGTGTSYAVALGLEQARGLAECPHCEHVFPKAKGQLQCPACTRPLQVEQATHAGPGGMTRAQTGAAQLLCVQCAKAYAADVCPVHPDEPLLDPSLEVVRLQLSDLDAQAGTRRFVSWTGGLGGPAPAPSTGGVCMECAKPYATTCPLHPDEPLLDPTVEAVRLQMEDDDDRRRNRVGTRLMFAAAGLALAVTVGISSLVGLDGSLMVSTLAASLLGLIAVARVLTPALSPPRFGAWTAAEAPTNADLARSARAELLDPIQRGLRRVAARLSWFAAATAIGALLGGLLGFVLGAAGLGALLGGLLGLLGFVGWFTLVDTGRELKQAATDAAKQWHDPYAP